MFSADADAVPVFVFGREDYDDDNEDENKDMLGRDVKNCFENQIHYRWSSTNLFVSSYCIIRDK